MTACTHPREPGDDGAECRTCARVRRICDRYERDQKRLNERRYTLGQRIARGIE